MSKKPLTKTETNSRTNPVELMLYSHAVKNECKRRRDEAGNHGWESHLWVTNATIALREPVSYKISHMTTGGYSKNGANDCRNEAETDLPGLEVIRSLERSVHIGSNSDQEANCDGLDESGPEHWRQADQPQGSNDHLEKALVSQLPIINLQTLNICFLRGDRCARLFDIRHGSSGFLARRPLCLVWRDIRHVSYVCRFGEGEEGH